MHRLVSKLVKITPSCANVFQTKEKTEKNSFGCVSKRAEGKSKGDWSPVLGEGRGVIWVCLYLQIVVTGSSGLYKHRVWCLKIPQLVVSRDPPAVLWKRQSFLFIP